jgi:cyclopropane-fatty-acyl-phospholipid synthase
VSAADEVRDVLEAMVAVPLPVRLRCWDGSESGPPDSAATVVVRRRRALRRLVWSPDELGLARAYVSGDLDVEGDVFAVLDLEDVIARVSRDQPLGLSGRQRLAAARTALRLGVLGPPPPRPPEELRRARGRKHSRRRDARSVSHHYDVGNEFYRLVLGPSLVYSCAYWAEPPGPAYGLDAAQRDKLELVCAKLGLRPGMRLLDVGCGWGSLLLHAAAEHGVIAVGVTVSAEQAELARRRVAEAGLADRVEVRLQDYRDVADGPYDAISSIGMAEHVGRAELAGYAAGLAALLRPGGRLLNHAISSVRALPERPDGRPTFIGRYVFPDGEVLPLSATLDALERAGLEVRDVEALREHYGWTLRSWVANLRGSWPEAVRLVGEGRGRTWLLYLASAALAFERGGLTVHQTVAVRQDGHGGAGWPRTRAEWLRAPVAT